MWTRNENIEDSFLSLHNYKVEVYLEIPVSRGRHSVKLAANGKEVVLTETLERGLTKEAKLEFNGDTMVFKRVYDAEKKAVEIFKGA
jgi:hypothetical protein